MTLPTVNVADLTLLLTENTNYVNLLRCGLTTEKAVFKLKLSKPTLAGKESYQYLQQNWQQGQVSFFEDFLRWCYNRDVLPTLEAMRKMINFYRDKDIEILKLGCTITSMANICPHKPIETKVYPVTEADKDLLEITRENGVGGPSIIFTGKAVVNEKLSLQTYAN